MEKNLRTLIKSLNTGKNVEEALEEYIGLLNRHYYEISLLNLAMNYATLYEKMLEGGSGATGPARSVFEAAGSLFSELVSGGEKDTRELWEELLEQRKRITAGMRALTSYADRMENFEYVLNRLERSFEPEEEAEDDTVFINRVLSFLFGDSDQALINARIREVIGQLPVRMARARYFDLIKESYSVYAGSDRSALDTYDYMLRTCAMLEETKESPEAFRNFEAFLAVLFTENFSSMEKERFLFLVDRLKEEAAALRELTDLYANLQETVNDGCAFLLAGTGRNRGEPEPGCSRICREIVQDIGTLIRKGANEPVSDAVMDKFQKTEGRPEKLMHERELLEAELGEIKSNYREMLERLELSERFDDLLRMNRLLSNSLFMDLNPEEEETAGEDYVRQKTGRMLDDLEKSFRERPRVVNRAVIANTINKMPVFFHSAREAADYIRLTLEQCGDRGEKEGSKDIINRIIEEETQGQLSI